MSILNPEEVADNTGCSPGCFQKRSFFCHDEKSLSLRDAKLAKQSELRDRHALVGARDDRQKSKALGFLRKSEELR